MLQLIDKAKQVSHRDVVTGLAMEAQANGYDVSRVRVRQRHGKITSNSERTISDVAAH